MNICMSMMFFDNTITYKGKPFNVMQYESRGNNYILCEKRDLAAFVDFEINKKFLHL